MHICDAPLVVAWTKLQAVVCVAFCSMLEECHTFVAHVFAAGARRHRVVFSPATPQGLKTLTCRHSHTNRHPKDTQAELAKLSSAHDLRSFILLAGTPDVGGTTHKMVELFWRWAALCLQMCTPTFRSNPHLLLMTSRHVPCGLLTHSHEVVHTFEMLLHTHAIGRCVLFISNASFFVRREMFSKRVFASLCDF